VLSNLRNLRDSSRSFFDKSLFTKSGDLWKIPGGYALRESQNIVEVLKNENVMETFSSKKNATAWCILRNNGRSDDAILLRHHDSKISFLQTNIIMNERAFELADDAEYRNIIEAKLSNDYQKLNYSKKQVDKFINLAKYFQRRGFEYEAF